MPETFPAQWQDAHETDEYGRVVRWRYDAARQAGLSTLDAELFANGDGDLGLFRHAAAAGATLEQLSDIFT